MLTRFAYLLTDELTIGFLKVFTIGLFSGVVLKSFFKSVLVVERAPVSFGFHVISLYLNSIFNSCVRVFLFGIFLMLICFLFYVAPLVGIQENFFRLDQSLLLSLGATYVITAIIYQFFLHNYKKLINLRVMDDNHYNPAIVDLLAKETGRDFSYQVKETDFFIVSFQNHKFRYRGVIFPSLVGKDIASIPAELFVPINHELLISSLVRLLTEAKSAEFLLDIPFLAFEVLAHIRDHLKLRGFQGKCLAFFLGIFLPLIWTARLLRSIGSYHSNLINDIETGMIHRWQPLVWHKRYLQQLREARNDEEKNPRYSFMSYSQIRQEALKIVHTSLLKVKVLEDTDEDGDLLYRGWKRWERPDPSQGKSLNDKYNIMMSSFAIFERIGGRLQTKKILSIWPRRVIWVLVIFATFGFAMIVVDQIIQTKHYKVPDKISQYELTELGIKD